MNFKKIKELQTRFNVTDSQMARIMGYKSPQSVPDLEKAKSFKLDHVVRLSKHFNVPYSYFLDDDTELSNCVSENSETYSLKSVLAEKDKQIEFLKARVTYFENLVNEFLKARTDNNKTGD